MKRFFMLLVTVAVLLAWASSALAVVRVRGYFRKDGTYVQPHYRSDPDGIPNNNFSYPGNYNPNTGEITGGNADTYLDNKEFQESLDKARKRNEEFFNKLEADREKRRIEQEAWKKELNRKIKVLSGSQTSSSTAFVYDSSQYGTFPYFTGVGSEYWMDSIPNRWSHNHIEQLQSFLSGLGLVDYKGTSLVADGKYGQRTKSAHMVYFLNRKKKLVIKQLPVY